LAWCVAWCSCWPYWCGCSQRRAARPHSAVHNHWRSPGRKVRVSSCPGGPRRVRQLRPGPVRVSCGSPSAAGRSRLPGCPGGPLPGVMSGRDASRRAAPGCPGGPGQDGPGRARTGAPGCLLQGVSQLIAGPRSRPFAIHQSHQHTGPGRAWMTGCVPGRGDCRRGVSQLP